uniref:Hemolysin XhlA family protein n=1 Tax=Streptomyces sp. NBC_00093 TaxID=2975649 RepID=A0AAU1ZZE1_9ACTN
MTTPDPAGVYISSAQMYQELRSLSDGLTRVETKLDGIGQGLTDLGKDVADHETRLRTLERARWPLPTIGVLAGLAGATTGAVALFAR